MLKRILLAVMLCVAVGTGCAPGFSNRDACAGEFGVGALWNLSDLSSRTKWGVRGYVAISPNTLYQSGKGVIYHTHTNGSAYGPEVIVIYNDNNHLGLKQYLWVPTGRSWLNVLTSATGSGSTWDSLSFLIGNGDGTIDNDFSPYVKDLFIGVETKKVIYIECVSEYTSGNWDSITRIKNWNTGNFDTKWHYRWSGTQAENYNSSSNGHNQWAGALEMFNESAYASTNGKSAGNYLMDFINANGEWTAYSSTYSYLRTSDSSSEWVTPPGEGWSIYSAASGFTVYNSNPVPGFWLAKVQ